MSGVVFGSEARSFSSQARCGAFDDDPEKHAKNERYCIQDDVAERFMGRLVPPLPEPERRLWLAHQVINERGVPVDLDLCEKATLLVEREKERLCDELQSLAGIEPRAARVVECRFFGGLGVEETAEVMGISVRTVKRDWILAKAWLYRKLQGENREGSA